MFTIDPQARARWAETVNWCKRRVSSLPIFRTSAESWEAITYMKARTIAGDARSWKESFSQRLQDVLWQRFAHRENLVLSCWSACADRIEVEQGESKPLRSAPGGYYDIDFILLYWRLLHAESFYESLNTPERIEIIRKTDPSYDMDLDAAPQTPQRCIGRSTMACRVYKGASSHALPPTEWQRRMLEELLVRWVPDKLQHQSLEELVDTTMGSVRKVFNSAFSAG